MPPYADYVLSSLQVLARANSRRPVRTLILAELLGISPRTARLYLTRLENRGLVARLSPRSGWLPAEMAPVKPPSFSALAAGRGRAAALTTHPVLPA